jgi:hypothetical protein
LDTSTDTKGRQQPRKRTRKVPSVYGGGWIDEAVNDLQNKAREQWGKVEDGLLRLAKVEWRECSDEFISFLVGRLDDLNEVYRRLEDTLVEEAKQRPKAAS